MPFLIGGRREPRRTEVDAFRVVYNPNGSGVSRLRRFRGCRAKDRGARLAFRVRVKRRPLRNGAQQTAPLREAEGFFGQGRASE